MGGEGKALSLPRTREFELLKCPTELVSERLPPALPCAAFQNCLNEGMGQEKSPTMR